MQNLFKEQHANALFSCHGTMFEANEAKNLRDWMITTASQWM